MDIFDAIHLRDIEACKKFVENGADLNNIYQGDFTPLGVAILYGYEEIANLFRNHGASWEKCCIARIEDHVCNNNFRYVKLLLKKFNYDVNSITFQGKSLLHISVESVFLDMTAVLLKYGANPNVVWNEQSFLDSGYCRSKKREEDRFSIIQLLLDYGANPTNSETFHKIGRGYVNSVDYVLKIRKVEAVAILSNHIGKQNKIKINLILMAHEYDEQSLLHRDYLPRDMLRLIFQNP